MSDDIEDNSELIRTKKRRLNALQLRAAAYGINAPPEVSIEIEDLEKEIKRLQDSAQASVLTPVQPSSGQAGRLTLAQKRELIAALLACPTIANRNSRDTLLSQLRPEISNRTVDNNRTDIHVLNIIDTSMSYPGGLEEFIDTLRFFEGDSASMNQVDAVLNRIIPGFQKP
jgi:hypothetical protein